MIMHIKDIKSDLKTQYECYSMLIGELIKTTLITWVPIGVMLLIYHWFQ